MALRRILVLARAECSGAPLARAVAEALALPAPVEPGSDAAPGMVHVVGFAWERDLAGEDPALPPLQPLREALLDDVAGWLQAAVDGIDSRGNDLTWEAVWADDPVAWVAGCLHDGAFDGVLLPVLPGSDPDGAALAAALRAVVAVPVRTAAPG